MIIPKMPLRSKILLALLIFTIIVSLIRSNLAKNQSNTIVITNDNATTNGGSSITIMPHTMPVKVINGVLSAGPAASLTDSNSEK